jgi:hypothetical protein
LIARHPGAQNNNRIIFVFLSEDNMLKSDINFLEDSYVLLEKLEAFLNHIFKDTFISQNISNPQNVIFRYYYDDYNSYLSLIANGNQAQLRAEFIPIINMQSEMLIEIIRLFNRCSNEKFDFNSETFLAKVEYVQGLIKNFYVQLSITKENIEEFFKHLLELASFAESMRSNLSAKQQIQKMFNIEKKNITSEYYSESGENLTVRQVSTIFDYLDTFIDQFFPEYINMFYCEFDTGTPSAEVSINVNVSLDLDVQECLKTIFSHLEKNETAMAIKNVKRFRAALEKEKKTELSDLKEMKKILSDEEYKDRYMKIIDKYCVLRQNGIGQIIGSMQKSLPTNESLLLAQDTSEDNSNELSNT